ncbi:geranylgeranyl reductase family protein [Saccharopolyspora sp. NPDC002578]
MTQESFDIVVVGAGPAGSVAAYSAARRGLRVALVDRAIFPRDKTCGDGVGPGAVEVIHRLGLGNVFADRTPINDVTIFGPVGEQLHSAISRDDGRVAHGHVISRLELDDRLVRAAMRAGAADFTGMRYLSMVDGPSTREVRLRAADGTLRSINARLVVGSDGAHSAIRKELSSETDSARAKKHRGLASRAYAESGDFQPGGKIGPRLLFDFRADLLPHYAWLFPLTNGLVNIGIVGSLKSMQDRDDDIKALTSTFADSVRARGIELGELHDQRAYHLPHVGGLAKMAHPRAVLIGDAASMINPVSGEGIAYAVSAAERLVEALPPSLDDGAALAAALTGFEADFRRRYRAHFVSSLVSQRLLRNPRWASALLRTARHDPRMLADGVEMLFGFGRIHASTVLRILRFW